MKSLCAGLLAVIVAAACTHAIQVEDPSGEEIPPPTPAAASVEALAPVGIERAFPGLSLRGMVAMTFPDDGSDRLFLAQKHGVIAVFPNDQAADRAATFLDITDRVNDRGSEEGLLGLAFDPGFAENGYLYVYYSASGPRRIVVSRFQAARDRSGVVDLDSERVVLEVPQPYANHNGGQLAFGPDGYLYAGIGDGGSRGDPHGNGQDPSTLLGTIIRIDVSTIDSLGGYAVPPDNPFVDSGGGAREEVWAYGLRNPWRFAFDRQTGTLWAADVGQWEYEEIDVVRPGLNYGWSLMEGTHCYSPRVGCDRTGLELPVAEYEHDLGCSITGGYVYRGTRLPALLGAYLYGDFCSGRIWALRYDGGQVREQLELVETDLSISSFGEDQAGEIYVLDFDPSGSAGIYRLVPR